MQLLCWLGIILFATVLAYGEVVLAKALGKSLTARREGDDDMEMEADPGTELLLRILLAVCFGAIILLNSFFLIKLLGG